MFSYAFLHIDAPDLSDLQGLRDTSSLCRH